MQPPGDLDLLLEHEVSSHSTSAPRDISTDSAHKSSTAPPPPPSLEMRSQSPLERHSSENITSSSPSSTSGRSRNRARSNSNRSVSPVHSYSRNYAHGFSTPAPLPSSPPSSSPTYHSSSPSSTLSYSSNINQQSSVHAYEERSQAAFSSLQAPRSSGRGSRTRSSSVTTPSLDDPNSTLKSIGISQNQSQAPPVILLPPPPATAPPPAPKLQAQSAKADLHRSTNAIDGESVFGTGMAAPSLSHSTIKIQKPVSPPSRIKGPSPPGSIEASEVTALLKSLETKTSSSSLWKKSSPAGGNENRRRGSTSNSDTIKQQQLLQQPSLHQHRKSSSESISTSSASRTLRAARNSPKQDVEATKTKIKNNTLSSRRKRSNSNAVSMESTAAAVVAATTSTSAAAAAAAAALAASPSTTTVAPPTITAAAAMSGGGPGGIVVGTGAVTGPVLTTEKFKEPDFTADEEFPPIPQKPGSPAQQQPQHHSSSPAQQHKSGAEVTARQTPEQRSVTSNDIINKKIAALGSSPTNTPEASPNNSTSLEQISEQGETSSNSELVKAKVEDNMRWLNGSRSNKDDAEQETDTGDGNDQTGVAGENIANGIGASTESNGNGNASFNSSYSGSPHGDGTDPENDPDQDELTAKFHSLLAFLSEAQVKDLDYIGNVYNNINSIFDLERYLSTLVANESTLNFLVTPPGVATPIVWTFLHIKRLIKELNWLAVAVSLDGCGNSDTHPECRVMYKGPPKSPAVLCGNGHTRPQQCAALDYIWHTLDWAMSTVNNGAIDLQQPLGTVIPALTFRTLSVAFKRLFQIFEHAWYFHQRVFVGFENVTNLYQRALAFGIFSKMLTRVPLIPYKLAFRPEEITGLDEESYMKELTYLVQNAHRNLQPQSFSLAHMRAMGL